MEVNMKKKVLNKQRLFTFIFCLIFFIIIFLIFIIIKINQNTSAEEIKLKEIEKKSILENTELYTINVEYPYFYNSDTDDEIKEFIDYQVNQIKETTEEASLTITYNFNEVNNLDYLVFKIDSSCDELMLYKSYLVNERKIESFDKIFNLDEIKEKTLAYAKNRYSTEIYNSIDALDFSNLNYLMNKDYLILYLYDLKTSKMSYVPKIIIDMKDLNLITKINIDEDYSFPTVEKNKYIAFTFDDGPSTVTSEILDILEIYDAHVTFFSIGGRMNIYKSIVKREYDLGHQVASHSYSHKDLTSLTDSEVLTQINKTNNVYQNITGDTTKLFVRPPFGLSNDHVLSLADAPFILWNIDTNDWDYLDQTKISNVVFKKAFNGGIVLMHDLYKETKESLKIILPELEAQGYNFVTISEMAEEFNVDLLPGKIYRYIE
jgi:peptidoglycan/xylan/chitin deacetylase (PgdA/CDA1 family)